MKMQSLGVLFVIIILPIFIAVSLYINMQIDTVSLQSKYDSKLHNATHDAIKAFQINETNSNTQNIATEKIRDIEASIETFFNSLAMSLGLDAFGENELSPYVPALAYTLYDGYYIYSAFNNISSAGGATPKYERGLKPFIYYSARYTTSGGIDVTVNYTLDNYITVYGNINGEYVTKSGYLINPNDFEDHGSTITYKGLTIGAEELKETIMYQTTTSSVYRTENNQRFVYKETENNQREKVYKDDSSPTDLWYRISVDRRKIELTRDVPASPYDESAVLYYKKAAAFSRWVVDNLSGLKLKDTVGYNSTLANDNPEANIYYINSDIANEKIFDLTNPNNTPENEKSIFNEHRRNVIKYAVQTNLNAAIAGYNSISQVSDTTYNFKMPVLKETDWDKILNNVSLISFMQGLPIKNAYYNGYSIVTNNKNREFVDADFIYFSSTGDTNDNSVEYHTIYDEEALKNLATSNNIIGYRNLDFERQRMYDSEATIVTEGYKDTGITSKYYYKHGQSACYNCIITNFVRNDSSKYTDGNLPNSLSQYLSKLTTRR